MLRRAREWACWAQGFAILPNEVRWALALVFDFANVMIVRQAQEIHAALEKAGAEGAEQILTAMASAAPTADPEVESKVSDDDNELRFQPPDASQNVSAPAKIDYKQSNDALLCGRFMIKVIDKLRR